MDRRTALVGVPVLLSGCANVRSAADDTVLAPNEGLLVVQAFGDRYGSLGFRPYSESSYGERLSENLLGAKDALAFGPREEFLVRPLAAGDYMWTKLSIDNKYAWLESSTRFKVTQSTITYIGFIRVALSNNRFEIRVIDREPTARTYLAANYPKSFAKLPLRKELAEVRIRG